MIDTLLRFLDSARSRRVPARFGLKEREYCLATLHRPDNVDEQSALRRVLEALVVISRLVPVVFPVHPRTQRRLEDFGLDEVIAAEPGLLVTGPLGYLDFLGLTAGARIVLTDSGGIQEETTVLGVPGLTMRESTERPVTVTDGTNRIVGSDPELIVEEALTILEGRPQPARIPELWDGRAGERIVEHLRREIYEGMPTAASAG
jgi:UDP-N-acetylglucosamine 2-epimerase (non-hydrolysing)